MCFDRNLYDKSDKLKYHPSQPLLLFKRKITFGHPNATKYHDITPTRQFNLVDLDHGGTIDIEELRELMDLLGMEASEDEMAVMVDEIDSQGTGEISFVDFVRVMSKKVQPDYTAEQVLKAFEKFRPKDCPPHTITQDALVQVLSSYEGKMPVAQARELVDKIECDPKTKLINFNDYVNMMMADAVKPAKKKKGK